MSISTTVYAHDQKGKLAVFKIDNAASFADAIEAVKSDLSVTRALCVVAKRESAKSTQPTKEKEVA